MMSQTLIPRNEVEARQSWMTAVVKRGIVLGWNCEWGETTALLGVIS